VSTKYAAFQPLSTPSINSEIYANAYANTGSGAYGAVSSSNNQTQTQTAMVRMNNTSQQHQQLHQHQQQLQQYAAAAAAIYGNTYHALHHQHHGSQPQFHHGGDDPQSSSSYYYHPLHQHQYANYYQAAPSLTGHEEPISRPVSNLSNKSSEQYYTYPYQRKQQEQIFKPIDWCTLVHWARRVVQSRDDDHETKTDCSHGMHDIKGLKRHEHQHSWPHVQPHECNVLFLAKVMQRVRMENFFFF
jgi:hypothetical protein